MQNSDAAPKTVERYIWADFIRAVAVFLVVLIHATADWLKTRPVNFDWAYVNILHSCIRVAIPLFFMLSGFLLIKKPISLGNFYKKRFLRIAIPWIVWSGIIALYSRYYLKWTHITLSYTLIGFFTGNVANYLWFMYALVGLYLCIPIFSWMLEKDETKRGVYFIIIWLAAISLTPFFNRGFEEYFIARTVNVAFDYTMFSGYTGFLLLGYLLGKKVDASKKTLLISSITFLAMLILTFYLTKHFSDKKGSYDETFHSYIAPNIVIMTCAAFIILKNIGVMLSSNEFVAKVLLSICKSSLGMYLAHPLILLSFAYGAFGDTLASWYNNVDYSRPFFAVVAFILSYLVPTIILKIPIIRRIV